MSFTELSPSVAADHAAGDAPATFSVGGVLQWIRVSISISLVLAIWGFAGAWGFPPCSPQRSLAPASFRRHSGGSWSRLWGPSRAGYFAELSGGVGLAAGGLQRCGMAIPARCLVEHWRRYPTLMVSDITLTSLAWVDLAYVDQKPGGLVGIGPLYSGEPERNIPLAYSWEFPFSILFRISKIP